MKEFFQLGLYQAEQTITVEEYESTIRGKIKPFFHDMACPEFVVHIDNDKAIPVSQSIEIHGTLEGYDAAIYLDAANEANKYAQLLANKARGLSGNPILVTHLFKNALEQKDYKEFFMLSVLCEDLNKPLEKGSPVSIIDWVVSHQSFEDVARLYIDHVFTKSIPDEQKESLRYIEQAIKALFKRSSLVTKGNDLMARRIAVIKMLQEGINSYNILRDRKLYFQIEQRAFEFA
jgi:hypothetical protein